MKHSDSPMAMSAPKATLLLSSQRGSVSLSYKHTLSLARSRSRSRSLAAEGKRGKRGERGKSKRRRKCGRWRGKTAKATASAPQSRSGGDGLLLEEVDSEPHRHG
jgi:hypothetical protein